MGEYNGKINVSKDSMLFVVNSVFNQGIKESTTKENILKLMPAIYENADDEEIIKMLSEKRSQKPSSFRKNTSFFSVAISS